MWITHSFVGTTLGRTKCLFFLLHEDYLEAQRGLSQAVRDELERFARNLGDAGAVVVPFPGDAPATHQNVLDKNWSESERHEVRQTPAVLMIEKNFDEFDPRQHSWVLFHLDHGDDGTCAAKLRSLLQKISDAVRSTDGDAFAIVERAIRQETIAKAAKAFKLQPGALGVSINLRTAWAALKEYLRDTKTHS